MVRKPSGLISIENNLNIIEMKLFDCLLGNAIKNNNNQNEYEIALSKLKKEALCIKQNDKNNNYYKKALENLNKKETLYNILKKDKIINGFGHLIDDMSYYRNKKEIILKYKFPALIQEALNGISQSSSKSLFAEIDIYIIKSLKSKYSRILYQICKDYEKVEIPMMTIEEFKRIFGIYNKRSYKINAMSHMKYKVLKPAIRELNNNEKIKFNVDCKLIKIGKSYSHIKFSITPKTQQAQIEQKKEKIHIDFLLKAIPEEHRTKQLEIYLSKCLNDHDAKYLLHQIEYTTKNTPHNFFAYLKQAIKEDYANNEKATIEDEIESIKQKYQPQIEIIKTLKKLKIDKVKIRTNEFGNVFYFSDIFFEEKNLVILEEKESNDEMYPNSINVVNIPINKNNEEKIINILNKFKKILGG